MAWGRKNTRKNTGKPDAIGFKGKFLIDAHKRDTEYLANIEALHTFKHRYDRVVSPAPLERSAQDLLGRPTD